MSFVSMAKYILVFLKNHPTYYQFLYPDPERDFLIRILIFHEVHFESYFYDYSYFKKAPV